MQTFIQPSLPGKTAFSAGLGHFKDQTALGFGVNHWLKTKDPEKGPRILLNMGASISEGGGNDNVYRLGVGVEF